MPRGKKNYQKKSSSNFGEPLYSADHILSISDEIISYNWYHENKTIKDARIYLYSFLEKNGQSEKINLLKNAPDWKISLTAGWLARMLENGLIFSSDKSIFINKKIDEAIDNNVCDLNKVIVNYNDAQSNNKIETAIIDIKNAFDHGINFNIENYAKLNLITNANLKKIKTTIKEETSIDNDFIEKIIEDIDNLTKSIQISKPRKKRAIKPENLVKYITQTNEILFGSLKMIDPIKIIGAKEIWLYNPVYNMITVLYSNSDDGFSVHKKYITNIDETRSISKTATSKPDLVCLKAVNSNIKDRAKIMETINRKPSKLVTCIRKETRIIAIYKY